MKGIILAGGSGTRLYPLTKSISKQMLPVYDKPMIYYPLSILMLFGIRDILIISTPHDMPAIEKLLGDGSQFGISLSYKIQPSPDGIAQAFILGEEFIGGEPCALILGDNIFYTHGLQKLVEKVNENQSVANIFAYKVPDPERFGVIEFDKDENVLSIEEKPENPKSNYAAVGLYFYPADVVEKAKTLKPSARGEFEITDLSDLYLKEGRLKALPFGRGSMWIDAGTPDSLMDAAQFVQIVEKRESIKIACLEEVALRKGFITADDISRKISELKKGNYAEYLKQILEEFK